MKKKYVGELKWLEEDEMLDVTAVIFDVVINLAGNVVKTGRAVQCGRRICGDSADSGPDCPHPQTDDNGGVFGSGHCGGDDAGALVILRKYKVSAIAIIFGSGVAGTLAYGLMGAIM